MKLSSYPHLVKEWHPTKNGDLTPDDFTHASNEKVWWLCLKNHSYNTLISGRTRNRPTGCPYCSGNKVGEDNNLQAVFPKIAKEFHPTMNGELTAKDFTHGTAKKVWWLCPKGHSYDAKINNRTGMKSNCPYCSGQRVGEDNNLLVIFPDIAKEWHPTKNGELSPKNFTSGSNKKVWWLCPKHHSYDSSIYSRSKGKTGCPYCSGRRASEDNNLLFLFPEIAKEWHPTKNGKFSPKDFTPGSDTKAWWLCPKGHNYDAVINSRTVRKISTGCPYCSGNKVSEDNNLQKLFPEIATEWHPTKNGKITANDVSYGSGKKVWWLCLKGHSYEARIHSRTGANPTGCPKCSNQSSEPEIRILSELKWFFEEVNSRYSIKGKEVDIFLPKLNIAIEYDGSYWHKNKTDKDLEKNKVLLGQNILLIRVRQHPLKPLSEKDIMVHNKFEKNHLNEILKIIHPFVDEKIQNKIFKYFDKSSFVNEELFKTYKSYFPSPFPEHSLLKNHPLLSSEWDYSKNYPLTPENFSPGSRFESWWLCDKGHSYEKKIIDRTGRNHGCPYCSGYKVGEDNNLLFLFPDIAKEWHPTKNGDLSPENFTTGSNKKVWWLCKEGHTYETQIQQKTRKTHPSGCPFCGGKKVGEDNNLLFLFPEIAKQWHPTKNGELTPKDFTYGSSRKVWWICTKGHSFEQAIKGRTNKKQTRGCPYCAGKKVGEDNNLLFLFPEIAKEWHPTKNGELTPNQVTSKSGKKVWWLCPKSHSYNSVIKNRTRNKSGCPYCAGRRTLNLDLFN